MREYDQATLEKLHNAEISILKDFASVCDKYDIPYFAISGSAIGAVRHQGFIPWDDDIDIAMLRPDYERFKTVAPRELNENYYMMGPDFDINYYNLQPALVRKNTKFVTDIAYVSGYNPGIFLDIFVFDNMPEDSKQAKKYARRCNFWNVLCFARNAHLIKLIKTQKGFASKTKYIISGVLGSFLRLIPGSRKWIYKKSQNAALSYNGKTKRYTAPFDAGATYMYVDTDEIFPLKDMPFENTTIKMIREYDSQIRRHMGEDYMQLPPENKRTNHCPVELDFGDIFAESNHENK